MERYSSEELTRVKALQRLAYDCATEVAAGLTVGVTEREAAERLGAALRARGVEGLFHAPFAWFGSRAAFASFRSPSWRRPYDNVIFARQFFPTNTRLESGMAGILDVAPIKDGFCADIGYSFSLGSNDALARAMVVLRRLRDELLALVRRELTMRAIYRAIDGLIADSGYENAHCYYPSSVLGHKIGRMPQMRGAGRMLRGFDVRTYLYLGRLVLGSLPSLSDTPMWNGSRLSNGRPAPGLWAMEPHIRKDGLGAKWEEILVIDESNAYWLDDELPHVAGTAPGVRSETAMAHPAVSP